MDSVGRFLGFLMFAGPAMLILAALILLPPYKGMKMHEYSDKCAAAAMGEKSLYLDCRSRVISDMRDDQVFTERLLISQTSLRPANQTVVVDKSLPPWSPMMINEVKFSPPPPPHGWLFQLANRLENPTTKLGLMLVMIGAGLAAVFLYGPPPPRKPVENTPGPQDAPAPAGKGATLRIVNRQS